MKHIFISYSHRDDRRARKIHEKLVDAGFEVWIDFDTEKLRTGENWQDEIDEGIANAFVILILYSNDSLMSPEVQHEWTVGMERGRKILPLLIKEIDRSLIHSRLKNIQYIDFINETSEDWSALVNRLNQIKPLLIPLPNRTTVEVRLAVEELLDDPPPYRYQAILDEFAQTGENEILYAVMQHHSDYHMKAAAALRLSEHYVTDKITVEKVFFEFIKNWIDTEDELVTKDLEDAIVYLCDQNSATSLNYLIQCTHFRQLENLNVRDQLAVRFKTSEKYGVPGLIWLVQTTPCDPFAILQESHLTNQELKSLMSLLGEIGDSRAVACIAEKLNVISFFCVGWHSVVRSTATKALAQIKGNEAVDALVTALQNSKSRQDIEYNIVEALRELKDPRSVSALIEALKFDDATASLAARALGEIGSADAVQGLVGVLSNDQIKGSAIDALKKIGRPAFTALEQDLTHSDAAHRLLVANTLSSVDWQPVGVDKRVLFHTATQDWFECVNIGRAAIPRLIQLTQDDDVKLPAIQTLGEIQHEDAIPTLRSFLNHADQKIREEAFRSVGRIVSPKAIESVLPYLNSENANDSARLAIAEISHKNPNLIVRHLHPDTVLSTRSILATILMEVQWHPRNEVEELHYLVAHQNWTQLRKRGEKSVSILIQYIHDKDENFIQNVIELMGDIGSTEPVPELIRLLDQGRLPRTILKALGRIGGDKSAEKVVSFLDSVYEKEASEAILAIGKDTIPYLVQQLYASSYILRNDTANILDQLRWQPTNRKETLQYNLAKQDWPNLTSNDEETLKVLHAHISDRSVEVRKQVCECLGKIRNNLSIPYLLRAIADHDEYAKFAAAKALIAHGDEAILALQSQLMHENADMRYEVGKVLQIAGWQPTDTDQRVSLQLALQNWDAVVELGTDALSAMHTLLGDKEDNIRTAVAITLGRMGAPSTVPLLEVLASGDTVPSVRTAAIQGLGNVKSDDSQAVLVNALKDPVNTVRRQVIQSLQRIDFRLPDDIGIVIDYHIASENWDALAKLGSDSVERISEMLKDDEQAIRLAAIRTLVRISVPLCKQAYIYALENLDFELRQHAVKGLSKLGDIALDGLEIALRDSNIRIRKLAVSSLFQVGEPAVPLLIASLQQTELRTRIIPILGKLGDRRATQPLVQIAEDTGSSLYRRVLIDALGNIGDPASTQVLRRMLYEEKYRSRVSNSLLKIGEAAIPELLDLLDANENVEQKVLFVNRTRAIPLQTIREIAYSILEAMGKKSIKQLIQALKDPRKTVREASYKLIVQSGEDSVLYLTSILSSEECRGTQANVFREVLSRSSECHIIAAILKEIGTPSALEAIVQWKTNSSVKKLKDEVADTAKSAMQDVSRLASRFLKASRSQKEDDKE